MLRYLLPDLLMVLAALFAWRGLRLLGRMLRDPWHRDAPFWLVRGGRGVILAIGLTSFAAGLFFEVRGLLWFGAVFLAEELYESGAYLLILRHDRKRSQASRP